MSDTLAIVAAAGFTAVASLGSVWITSRYAAKHESATAERERSAALFDLRRQTFMSLLAVTYQILSTIRSGGALDGLLADLGKTHAEVQMITGRVETANAATELNDAAVDLQLAVNTGVLADQGASMMALTAARQRFIAECRRDLKLWIDLPATGSEQTAGVSRRSS